MPARPIRPRSLPERAQPRRPSHPPERAPPGRTGQDTDPFGQPQSVHGVGNTLPLGGALPSEVSLQALPESSILWLEADATAVEFRGDGQPSVVINVRAVERIGGQVVDATHEVIVQTPAAESSQIRVQHAPGWCSFTLSCHRFGAPLRTHLVLDGHSKRGRALRSLSIDVHVVPIVVLVRLHLHKSGYLEQQIDLALPVHCASLSVRIVQEREGDSEALPLGGVRCGAQVRIDGGQWSDEAVACSDAAGNVLFDLPAPLVDIYQARDVRYALPTPVPMTAVAASSDAAGESPGASTRAIADGGEWLEISANARDLDALCEFAAAPDAGEATLEYAQWMLQALLSAACDPSPGTSVGGWSAQRLQRHGRVEIRCAHALSHAEVAGICYADEWHFLRVAAGTQRWQRGEESAASTLRMAAIAALAVATNAREAMPRATLTLPSDYQAWLTRDPDDPASRMPDAEAPTQAILLAFPAEHQPAIIKSLVRMRERAGQLPNGLAQAIDCVAHLPALILERAPKHLAMEWQAQMAELGARTELRGVE